MSARELRRVTDESAEFAALIPPYAGFEKHAANYLALVKLAAIRLWLRAY